MALLHSINDLKKTDKLGVTTLNNESYNSWRASSFKKTTVDKLSLKVKQNNSYKSDQKLIKPSYNFKLIHASCEFQDNYLENKHFIKKTENKAENLNKFFSKNEQNPNIFETDNKTFIEKLEKKANNFNPELNLYNIMKIVTKELDNDEESRNLKEKIRPPNKMELLQRIKTQSLHTIQESIKKTEVDKLKNLTKIEISKISNDMSYLLDKSLRENQTLQIILDQAKKDADELKMENEKIFRRNQILSQNLKELRDTNEKLLQETQKLETFKKSYYFFTEKFPNYSIEKFIDKFLYLEESCLSFTKRICDLEDDNRAIDQEKLNIEKKIEQIHYKMDMKEFESERLLYKFQQENENAEKLLKDNDKYKESYLELFKRILNIFSKWTDKVKIFYDSKNPLPPQANVDDPVEMLDILDKIITISTPERLQLYLRKIIVITNVLQRKFFQENVNEKFDPDKIYNRIIQKIDKMENERINLLSELQIYRKRGLSASERKKGKSKNILKIKSLKNIEMK